MFKTRHIALIALIAVASCAAAPSEEKKPDPWKAELDGYNPPSITVWVDPGTGCHYLMAKSGNGFAMIPRLQSGSPYCSDDDITLKNE